MRIHEWKQHVCMFVCVRLFFMSFLLFFFSFFVLYTFLPVSSPPLSRFFSLSLSVTSQMTLEKANNQDGKCVEKSLKSQLPTGSVLQEGDQGIVESNRKASDIWKPNSCVCVCSFYTVCVLDFAPLYFCASICECVYVMQTQTVCVCTSANVQASFCVRTFCISACESVFEYACAKVCVSVVFCVFVNQCPNEKRMFNSLCHKSALKGTILNFIAIFHVHFTLPESHLSLSKYTLIHTLTEADRHLYCNKTALTHTHTHTHTHTCTHTQA